MTSMQHEASERTFRDAMRRARIAHGEDGRLNPYYDASDEEVATWRPWVDPKMRTQRDKR